MQQLYEAILGEKNRIYYLAKFEKFDKQGLGLKASWNWPALLCGGVWVLYRKMYGWFFAFWGIAVVSNIIEKAGSPGLSAVVFIAPWIAFTVYATSLYHSNIKKKIAVAQMSISDQSRLRDYLRSKGGVHTWVPWVFGGVPIIGIVAAIAIPILQDRQAMAPTPRTSDAVQHRVSPALSTLPFEEKVKVTGRAAITVTGHLVGNIYNGNPDWTLTEVTINISEPDWFPRAVEANKQGKPPPRLEKYRLELSIPPYTNRDFSISVNWSTGEKYEWNIYEAKGFKN